eukprot:724125-Amphidinium_carterae.1
MFHISNTLPQGKTLKNPGKRAGGTWHAFLSEDASGSKGRPNWKHLGKRYRDMNKKSDERLVRIGAAAQYHGNRNLAKTYGVSNFGPAARFIQRQREKIRQVSAYQGTVGLEFDKKVAVLSAMADFQAGHLRAFVKLCRKHQQLDSAEHLAKEKALLSDLAHYEQTIGHQQKVLIQSLLQGPIAQEIQHWTPVPVVGGLCLQADPVMHPEIAQALDWANGSGQTNLVSSLQSEWEEIHGIVKEGAACPASGKYDEQQERSFCQREGFCMCTGANKRIWRMRNTISYELKQHFGSGKKGNTMDVGNVVVQFRSKADLGEPLQTNRIAWMHLGLIYFKPFRPTWHVLYPCEPPAGEVCPADSVYLELCFLATETAPEASNVYHTDCGLVHSILSPDSEWEMLFWQLEDSLRPIPAMTPGILCAKQSSQPKHLWPPRRKPYTRKPKPVGTLAMSVAVTDADGDLVVEQDDVEAETFFDEDMAETHVDAMDELEMSSPTGELLERALVAHALEPAVEPTRGSKRKPETDTVPAATRHQRHPVQPAQRLLVGSAESYVQHAHGRVAFYENKRLFQATCSAHPRCTLSRTANGKFIGSGSTSVSTGRPLGLIGAWLAEAANHSTKEQHVACTEGLRNSVQKRLDGRTALASLEGAVELFACERARGDDEPEEASS